jgi:autotransporter adhesin
MMNAYKLALVLLFFSSPLVSFAAPITIGNNAVADPNSIAIGESASATSPVGTDVQYGTGQVAVGYHATATGYISSAYGAYAVANGFKSTAIGSFSNATGYLSTTLGSNSNATGNYTSALGYNANASADYATAFGYASIASATYATAIGDNAKATKANSVALGYNSTTDIGAENNYVGYMLSQMQTSNGEVSIGSSTIKRKITNVAAGENDTDATNIAQLKSVNNSLTDKINSNSDRAVNYDLNPDNSINLLSLSLNKGAGNVVLRGVASGAVSATSTEAINGSQLYQTNQQVSSLQTSLSSLYTIVGNTNSKLDDTTAQTKQNSQDITDANSNITKNSQDIADTNLNVTKNTQDIADTNNKLNTTNANVAKNTTDIQNIPTNTPIGGNGSVGETKNADDIASTNTELAKTNVQVSKNTQDITNNTQDIAQNTLDIKKTNFNVNKNTQDIVTTNTKVDKLENKTVQYDQDGSGNNINKITLKGKGGSVISNVADGQDDSDAVNVKQLKIVSTQTNKNTKSIKSISEGKTGMVIVNNTSNKASPVATGKDSVAIGQGSSSTGNNSVAVGADSSDNGRANTVSVGNANVQRTISNVSSGTAATDAVNVTQLNSQVNSALSSANAYTDNLFSGLNNKIDKVDRQNKAGIASAMAMATIPQAYSPGKSMVALGMGSYSSESAISIGASVIAPEGHIVYKLNGSIDSRGTAGVAAGVGYQW